MSGWEGGRLGWLGGRGGGGFKERGRWEEEEVSLVVEVGGPTEEVTLQQLFRHSGRIMADGPRCKRRKQANPQRSNGENNHTHTHTNSKQTHVGINRLPKHLLVAVGPLRR